MDFKKDNTGQATFNEARITNDFDIDLPNCNIRFVMAKGKYKVSEGTIYQIIENPEYTVLDVRVDVGAQSSKEVTITKQ